MSTEDAYARCATFGPATVDTYDFHGVPVQIQHHMIEIVNAMRTEQFKYIGDDVASKLQAIANLVSTEIMAAAQHARRQAIEKLLRETA